METISYLNPDISNKRIAARLDQEFQQILQSCQSVLQKEKIRAVIKKERHFLDNVFATIFMSKKFLVLHCIAPDKSYYRMNLVTIDSYTRYWGEIEIKVLDAHLEKMIKEEIEKNEFLKKLDVFIDIEILN